MENLVLSPITIEDLAQRLSSQLVPKVRGEIQSALKEVTSLPEHPTIKQTAKFYGVSEVTIYDMIKRGSLTVDKLGTRTRLRREEILAQLKEVEK